MGEMCAAGGAACWGRRQLQTAWQQLSKVFDCLPEVRAENQQFMTLIHAASTVRYLDGFRIHLLYYTYM